MGTAGGCGCFGLRDSLSIPDPTTNLGNHSDVLQTQADSYTIMFGSSIWATGTNSINEDLTEKWAQAEAILTQTVNAMNSSSSSDSLIDTAEANTIRALPRPDYINEQDVNDLIDYMNRTTDLWNQGITTHAVAGRSDFMDADQYNSAMDAIEAAILKIENSGADSLDMMQAVRDVKATMGSQTAVSFPTTRIYYLLQDTTNNIVRRGQLTTDGNVQIGAVRANSYHEFLLYDPANFSYASTTFVSESVATPTNLPEQIFFSANYEPDPDGDGLPDIGEEVLGTNPNQPDTDGDGVNDGDEVNQNTDPLSRDLQIGEVIANEITLVGEVNRYTFTAAPGQVVYFDTQGSSAYFLDVGWKVEDSNGNIVFHHAFHDGESHVLNLGGTYTLTVYGNNNTLSTYQFQLWDVPSPEQFAINIGDTVSDGVPSAGAGNLETPGVVDIYTFTPASQQDIFFDAQGSSAYFLNVGWRVEDSNNIFVFNQGAFGDQGPFTLNAGETYTLTVYENTDTISTYQFQLVDQTP